MFLFFKSYRMLGWVLASLALIVLALLVQGHWPGSVVAVTAYKAHLMALGGWGGYWLDRALFPYDRPHRYLDEDPDPEPEHPAVEFGESICTGLITTSQYGYAMLRRAIIVAACLVCAGLGA